MPRITLTRAAIVGALVLGGGGVAAAAIPNADGTVGVCYKNAGGAARIVDSAPGQTCPAGETLLKLNQTGPKGATGAAGPQGPAGPSFVKAVFVAGTYYPLTLDTGAASLSLNPGKYHITAKAVARVDDEHLIGEVWARITCRLYRDPLDPGQAIALDQSQTEVSDDGPDVATISLEGLTTVASSGDRIQLVCRDSNTNGAGYDSMDQIKLFAQQVGNYESTIVG